MIPTFNTFDEKIKPLLDEIVKICKEQGIEYSTTFKLNNSQVANFKSENFNK